MSVARQGPSGLARQIRRGHLDEYLGNDPHRGFGVGIEIKTDVRILALRVRFGAMSRSLADALTIRTACHEDVAAMRIGASGQARYCTSCESEVHTISEMTHAEVTALLAANEGKQLCFALLVRKSDRAVRLADGHVVPPTVARKRLPLLAVAASMTMAACAPPAVARAPALVPVAEAPKEVPSEPAPVAPSEPVDESPGRGPRPLVVAPEPEPEPAPAPAPAPVAEGPKKTPSPAPHARSTKPEKATKPVTPVGPKQLGKPTPEEAEAYESLMGRGRANTSL